MKCRIFDTIIVDDEPAAIIMLEKVLLSYHEINVIAHFTNPEEALSEIIRLKPDVVFLDIVMPVLSGFDFIEALDLARFHPVIIFVTGFDSYAIDAIHHAAFDYLLKPVGEVELDRVIHRLLHNHPSDVNETLFKTLLETINPVKRIKIPTTGGFILVNTSDILYVEADWNYSDIYFDETTKHLVTINIGALEKMLPTADFYRISRSIIVNVNYLTKVNRLRRTAFLKKDGKEYPFKIPLLNIRKLESRLE
jgi:DNA-binding LytR/AlgR family response regulator